MAHLVSPLALRSGKTFLWPNVDSSAQFTNNLGSSTGLENSINSILQQHGYFLVKAVKQSYESFGNENVKILFYPLINPFPRQRQFPTLLTQWQFSDLNYARNPKLGGFLKKIWRLKQIEYDNRFIAPKVRKQLNKWVTSGMFRGSSNFYKMNTEQLKLLPKRSISQIRYYAPSSNPRKNWRSSEDVFSDSGLSRLVSLKVGRRISINSCNIFNYIAKKLGRLSYKNHQKHIWGQFHTQKKFFKTYYDLVNTLYILSYIPFSEHLLISMIQYSLARMHRRRAKPKRLLSLIDQILKEMPEIQQIFHSFRVIITGKLNGGTARTSSISSGFGVLPRQSLSENIRFCFGDVHSKYGAYGVRVLTWRK